LTWGYRRLINKTLYIDFISLLIHEKRYEYHASKGIERADWRQQLFIRERGLNHCIAESALHYTQPPLFSIQHRTFSRDHGIWRLEILHTPFETCALVQVTLLLQSLCSFFCFAGLCSGPDWLWFGHSRRVKQHRRPIL